MAEDAKAHMMSFAQEHAIDMEFVPGQMSVVHKPSYLKDYQAHPAFMAERYDYPHIKWMDAGKTAERVGSSRYLGGTRDMGTGHIHPLKFLVGLAKAAAAAGARLCENTKVTKLGYGWRQGHCRNADRNDHRQQGTAGRQCVWPRRGAGVGSAHHADRLVHRRN